MTLKDGQILALNSLLRGKDVFAVLPTGYGKSLIYQCFVHAQLEIISGNPSIIVISPLKSIVQEQLKSNEFGLKAVELSNNEEVMVAIKAAQYQVVYASAEEVLADYFLAMLKDLKTPFRQNLSLIVVDECHTVCTW